MTTQCTAAAAVRLMMKFPFWCELYYSMKVVESTNFPTLATNGKVMWVNPEYWAKLDSIDYRVSALAHETTHKMLHHCTRGLHMIEPFGNIAADIVVNTMLAENGFRIHPTWVQPESKYKGWTFEQVYDDIIKNLPKPPKGRGGGQGTPKDGGEQGDGEPGGGEDDSGSSGPPSKGSGKPAKAGKKSPAQAGGDSGDPFRGNHVPQQWRDAWADIIKHTGTKDEREAFERKIEQQVANAIASALAMGHAPAGVEMAMEKIVRIEKEQWYDHLHRFMQSLHSLDYNWARQNRRNAVLYDMVSPDLYSESLGEIVLFRDTSGSCYTQALQAGFNGHINGILSEAKPRKVHVCDFDAAVYSHGELDPGEIEFSANPRGGGGTSFVPLFEWIEEQGINPAVVIVLTDLCGTFPAEPPPYPVVWASTEKLQAPFGEVIYINQGGQ
jgi:predicted metal-dependent peptidase